MKKKKRPEMVIDVKTILIDIGNRLSYAAGWRDDMMYRGASQAYDHIHEAEGLLELVEVQDCGSVGGFSEGQTDEEQSTIFRRWLFLVNKYSPEIKTEARKQGNGSYYFVFEELKKEYERRSRS